MNRIQLSAAAWRSEQDAHRALHDCLTDLADTQLVIEDCALAADRIEKWGGFLAVFFDAAMENPHLSIRLLAGNGDYGK